LTDVLYMAINFWRR